MSTRTGALVLLEDFMEQALEKAKKEILKRNKNISKLEVEELAKIIGYGAIKYHIIKVSASKEVIFNWEQALSFEGDAAPYIQYAHARISSLFKKYKGKADKKAKTSLLKKPEEINLITKLAAFPEVVEAVVRDLKPYLIANYLYDLARLFNDFYARCPILSEKEDLKKARLLLAYCVSKVLRTGLSLLGITAPSRM